MLSLRSCPAIGSFSGVRLGFSIKSTAVQADLSKLASTKRSAFLSWLSRYSAPIGLGP